MAHSLDCEASLVCFDQTDVPAVQEFLQPELVTLAVAQHLQLISADRLAVQLNLRRTADAAVVVAANCSPGDSSRVCSVAADVDVQHQLPLLADAMLAQLLAALGDQAVLTVEDCEASWVASEAWAVEAVVAIRLADAMLQLLVQLQLLSLVQLLLQLLVRLQPQHCQLQVAVVVQHLLTIVAAAVVWTFAAD